MGHHTSGGTSMACEGQGCCMTAYGLKELKMTTVRLQHMCDFRDEFGDGWSSPFV
jgi:hypothetical protein